MAQDVERRGGGYLRWQGQRVEWVDDAEDLPPIFSDESKVSQILRNFISNAIKFTEDGEIRVSVVAESEDHVRFSVRDTGIGIAPEDQQRIFHDFTQVESPQQRRTRGTGLGLPLSSKLAALLGGRIELESEVGRGSTFTLVVPCDLSTVTQTEVHPDGAARGALT